MNFCIFLFFYITAFLRCRCQRFDFAVQNYNKKMIYANKMRKNSPKVLSNRPKKNQHAG